MRRFPPAFPALMLLLFPALLSGNVSGSFRPGFSLTWNRPGKDSERPLFSAPLRLSFRRVSGRAGFEAAWVLTPSAGDPALRGAGSGEQHGTYRIADPGSRLIPASWEDGRPMSLVHELDRLNFRLRLSFAAVTLGRQAVHWGIAKSLSPLDVIAPFMYGETDTEYRPGVDALRVVFPVGMMSELDAGAAAGRDLDPSESGFWVRGRFYALRTDAVLLAGCFRENITAGLGLNRSAAGGTAWLEATLTATGRLSAGPPRSEFWRLTAGYDRSWFGAMLYGSMEYHFSSPGANSWNEYADAAAGPAHTAGGVYLLGKHYLCPGVSWNPGPLWRFTAGALVNPADPSAYFSLEAEWSAGQNTVLRSGLNSGTGRDASEFAGWPGSLFISCGSYF